MAYNPSSTVHVQVTYAVNASGDPLFNPTIQSSDAPDYTAAKVEANAQCLRLSPEALQRVVS